MQQPSLFLVKFLPPVLSKDCQILSEEYKACKKYTYLFNLANKHPSKAVLEFQNLEGPLAAPLANLYAYALIKQKKHKKAEQQVKENYQNFPSHFQTQLNYADLCLRKKKFREIPKIFSSFDIAELFPDQKIPLTEFRGFMIIMGLYHLALKEKERAKAYYILAVKADPLYQGIYFLEKRLFRFEKIKKLFLHVFPKRFSCWLKSIYFW